MTSDEYDNCFVDFCSEVYVHLQHGLSHYHPLFEGYDEYHFAHDQKDLNIT